jgi:hypothetical protein
MKKTLLAATFTLLLIFSFFVSSATADNVTITIKGGFGCTITVTNNEQNKTVLVNASIITESVILYGGTNSTVVRFPLQPGFSFHLRSRVPFIEWVNAMAQVGNQTVTRKGISICRFVILFKSPITPTLPSMESSKTIFQSPIFFREGNYNTAKGNHPC